VRIVKQTARRRLMVVSSILSDWNSHTRCKSVNQE
jgi:hypothetical protein